MSSASQVALEPLDGDPAASHVGRRSAAVGAGRILLLFAASRVWATFWVYLGHAQRPYRSPVRGGFEGVDHWWLNAWTAYDAEWYLRIAAVGYEPHTAVFFPLYPWLLRLAGGSELAMAAWGVALSHACFALALVLFHRLALLDHPPQTAWRATWILAFFPTAAFFGAVYTESLFLCLLVASFLLARRSRWLGAGILGGAAALTRNPGVVIALALGLEYLRWLRQPGHGPRAGHLLALALPLLAFVLVQGALALELGEWLSGVSRQAHYHRAPSWPWVPVWRDVADLLQGRSSALLILTNVAAVGLAVGWSLHYRRQLRPSYALLLLAVVAMHLCYARTIPPYTIGAVRYVSTAFPFVLLAGHAVGSLPPGRGLRGAALALLLANAVFSMGFGSKAFLG